MRGALPAIVLGLVACGPKSALPAGPAPATGAPVAARRVDEKVTVENSTPYAVHVDLTSNGPDREDETKSFGPVGAGASGSGTIPVWTDGSFTVVAKWTVNGAEVVSRPYTAVLSPDEPVTPVSVTLTSPYQSGTLGVWTNVAWETPAGTDAE